MPRDGRRQTSLICFRGSPRGASWVSRSRAPHLALFPGRTRCLSAYARPRRRSPAPPSAPPSRGSTRCTRTRDRPCAAPAKPLPRCRRRRWYTNPRRRSARGVLGGTESAGRAGSGAGGEAGNRRMAKRKRAGARAGGGVPELRHVRRKRRWGNSALRSEGEHSRDIPLGGTDSFSVIDGNFELVRRVWCARLGRTRTISCGPSKRADNARRTHERAALGRAPRWGASRRWRACTCMMRT